jgi:hypothetical protein
MPMLFSFSWISKVTCIISASKYFHLICRFYEVCLNRFFCADCACIDFSVLTELIDFIYFLCCFRHFFFTAMLFTYGRFLSQQLVNTVTSDKLLLKLVSGFVKYQMFICYFLYIAGM